MSVFLASKLISDWSETPIGLESETNRTHTDAGIDAGREKSGGWVFEITSRPYHCSSQSELRAYDEAQDASLCGNLNIEALLLS